MFSFPDNLRYALFRLAFFVVALCAPLASAAGGAGRFAFRHVGMEAGLSHERVNSVCAGGRGFLWLSTLWGVDCYDGYSITPFTLPDSVLRGGEVLSAQELGADSMLVRLSTGYAILVRNSLTFSRADSFLKVRGASSELNGVWVDGRQNLWMLDGGEVVYSPARDPVCRFPLPSEASVSCVTSSRFGLAILLDDGRILRCAPPASGAAPVPQVFSTPVRSGAKIMRIDNFGDLWVVSAGGDSLWRKPMAGNGWELMNAHEYWSDEVPSAIVDVDIDTNRRIWLATERNGACVIDPSTGSVSPLLRDPASPISLRSNLCTCVKALASGAVVIGYQRSGFSVYHPSAFKFTPLEVSPRALQMLVSDVSCIESDGGRWAYVGSNGGGVFKIDVLSREAERLPFAKADVAERLAALPDGSLWAFVLGRGFARYGASGASGREPAVEYFGDNARVPDPLGATSSAGVVAASRSGCLWAAVGRKVIALPNATDCAAVFDRCAVATLEDEVVTIRAGRDSASMIILTRSSFLRARLVDGAVALERLTDYNLKADRPSDICVGSYGFYWVAVSRGVAVFNRPDSTGLAHLLRVVSLPQPAIALEAESRGGVVAATPSEACVFRVFPSQSVEGGYSIVSGRYNASSGLLVGVNSPRAMRAMPLGAVWIGAENGVNVYVPDVNDDSPVPVASFSRLALNGGLVMPGERIGGVCPLSRALPLCKQIVLPCGHGQFVVDFSALGVPSPECYMYTCELVGSDLPPVSLISPSFKIPDLPAGRYTLRVVAIDPDGRRSPHPAQLDIVFECPWYDSLSARVAVGAALVLVGFVLAFLCGNVRGRRKMSARAEHATTEEDVMATIGETYVASAEFSSIVLRAVAANVATSIDALTDDIRAAASARGLSMADSFAIRNLTDRLISANSALASVAGARATDDDGASAGGAVGRHDIVAVTRTIVRQVASITGTRQTFGFSSPLRNCVLDFDLEAFRQLLIDVVVDAIVSTAGQGFVRVMVERGKYGTDLVSVSVSIGGGVPASSLYFATESDDIALPQEVEACLGKLRAKIQTCDFGDGIQHAFIHIPM